MNISVKNASGRSLVELMIAMAIGLVILIAVSSLFLANKQTFKANDDKSRLDEEGRLALNFLSLHVRMAGYGSLTSPKATKTVDNAAGTNQVVPSVCSNFASDCTLGNSIRGCSGKFTDPAAVLPASTVALNCTADTTSDSFLVRYVVDADNTNVSAGGGITDCLGANIIPDATTGAFIVENRFFVSPKANGTPELHCKGNGAVASQPIAENVESMSITYGLSAGVGTQAVTRFATAAELEVTPANWDQVISARICLLVRSANDNITSAPQSYPDCTNKVVTATDRRLRSVFSTTVTIRARATGAI